MDKRWQGFMAGWLFAAAGYSLVLDAVGKEDYLAALPSLWVEWYITVPLAIVLLVISLLCMAPDPKGGEK